MSNPWEKIFEQDFKEAYEIAKENHLRFGEVFDLRARATASLLLRNYEGALADFLSINEIEGNGNMKSDGTYMDIGLCYYALGEIDKAVDNFKYAVQHGREEFYTSDISVPPAVLLFIGIKTDRQDIIKIAIKTLQRLSKFKTAGPNYLLGVLSVQELDRSFKQYPNGTYRDREQCKAEFYKAVNCLQNGLLEDYADHITRCVKIKGKYLEFAYYIAQVEYDVYLT